MNKRFLVARNQTILAWRNFDTELRGRLDVKHLPERGAVLLDVSGDDADDLSSILYRLTTVLAPSLTSEDVTQQLLTIQESHLNVVNIRQCLRGLYVDNSGFHEDQSWLIFHCTLESPALKSTLVGFARLQIPKNFGIGMAGLEFIGLVIAPLNQKDTKSALETARTFATLLADLQLRNQLRHALDESKFIAFLQRFANDKRVEFAQIPTSLKADSAIAEKSDKDGESIWFPGRGIVEDLRRRLRHYKSDYTDGICDSRAIQKTISTAVFLYCAILPTAIALGMLNETNTDGKMDVKKIVLSQWIGGLFFGVLGGQLFLVMLTSMPISIYIQVIQDISVYLHKDFFSLYTMTGLWCSFYVLLFAIFEVPRIMRYARRSLEELFGMFIAVGLIIKAGDALARSFAIYHPTMPHCFDMAAHGPPRPPPLIGLPPLPPPTIDQSLHPPHPPPPPQDPRLHCERAVGPVFALLMLSTVWLAVSLYEFRKTPFLSRRQREILAAYALPIGVLVAALVANFVFADVPMHRFLFVEHAQALLLPPFWRSDWRSHLICMGLGLPLAILFFMDQMIVTNTVDNTQNNLQKGSSSNWDFLVVAVINAVFSLVGLPWMHGALPQAFLHLRSLADVEDRIVDGVIQQKIVKNRETRVAILLAHAAMVPTYYWLLAYIRLIPMCIFHGVFLYLAYSSASGSEFCQRLQLLVTEQRAYPPCHYVRRVPQRVIHAFTALELIQLTLLLAIGFAPYPLIQLTFPIIIFLFIPFRYDFFF